MLSSFVGVIGGGQKVKIYVSFFVVLLRVHTQWGLERSKPIQAGKKTNCMVSS
jgi:hypothetical protein